MRTVSLLFIIAIVQFFFVNESSYANGQKDDDDDRFYLLLTDNFRKYCAGVNQRVSLRHQDIQITNRHGKPMKYITAPGEYYIKINNLGVDENLGYLSGDIRAEIQVPVLSSLASFSLPYAIIPEFTGLTTKCDEHSLPYKRPSSGPVTCRYCDICSTSKNLENLARKNEEIHKYFNGFQRGQQQFSDICNNVSAGHYEIERKFRLPGKAAIKKELKKQEPNIQISDDIRKRLEQQEGKMTMYLSLFSTGQVQPRSREQLLANAGGSCRCCLGLDKKEQPRQCEFLQKYGNCQYKNCLDAVTGQSCMPNTAEEVGCFILEFHYKFTEDANEARELLDEFGIEFDPNDNNARPPVDELPPIFKPKPNRPKPSVFEPKGRPHPSIAETLKSNKDKLNAPEAACLKELKDECGPRRRRRGKPCEPRKRLCALFFNPRDEKKKCCQYCSNKCSR